MIAAGLARTYPNRTKMLLPEMLAARSACGQAHRDKKGLIDFDKKMKIRSHSPVEFNRRFTRLSQKPVLLKALSYHESRTLRLLEASPILSEIPVENFFGQLKSDIQREDYQACYKKMDAIIKGAQQGLNI
jgi:hypothetical protein